MKTRFPFSTSQFCTGLLTVAFALTLPATSDAKDKGKKDGDKGKGNSSHKGKTPPGQAKKHSPAPQVTHARSSGGGSSSSRSKSYNYTSRDRDGDHDRDRHDSHDHHDHNDRNRVVYLSRPRSTFTLTLGNGYAGRGYYYGPSGADYYYERPEVRYYATREAAPREYYSSGYQGGSDAADVQEALARLGYYRGSIDGSLGPQSRSAIAAYQRDNGMRATGSVTPDLLDSLGLN